MSKQGDKATCSTARNSTGMASLVQPSDMPHSDGEKVPQAADPPFIALETAGAAAPSTAKASHSTGAKTNRTTSGNSSSNTDTLLFTSLTSAATAADSTTPGHSGHHACSGGDTTASWDPSPSTVDTSSYSFSGGGYDGGSSSFSGGGDCGGSSSF
ncbi:hypothetical protein JCM6882_001519 [Rhodosporidiobolus microsporus]